jgi:hypothetical protein
VTVAAVALIPAKPATGANAIVVPPFVPRTAKPAINKEDITVAPYIKPNDPMCRLLQVNAKLLGRKVVILIDSGSQCDFVSSRFVRHASARTLKAPDVVSVNVADGRPQFCDRLLPNAAMLCNGYKEQLQLRVANIEHDVILGKPWLARMNPSIDYARNIVQFRFDDKDIHWTATLTHRLTQPLLSAMQVKRALRAHAEMHVILLRLSDNNELAVADSTGNCIGLNTIATAESNSALDQLRSDFEEVFPDQLPACLPPRRDIDHKIDLVPGATPQSRPVYRLSPIELQELKKQLDELLEAGYIRPSKSPYGAPAIFVKKKDGTMRMCLDYRALNKITIKNRYPLPRIEELFDQVQGAKVFSKIDLRSAYHQVRIAEEDIFKTAFNTRYGHYEWLVLSFGLTNAPSTYQNLVNNVFKELLDVCVIVYLDDILVYSKNAEDHEKHLRQVMSLLRTNKLYAKWPKCDFYQQEVEYLGHIITGEGIKTDPAKVKAVNEWPTPTSASDIRAFIGLANYYRKFVSGYATIAAPLNDQLQKERRFVWTPDLEEAFVTLKAKLSSAPILRIADPTAPFRIETDASGYAIGAALLQQDDNDIWHPVAYESRKCKPAEKNYPVHERELLALIYALKTWRHYLYGGAFEAHTDHKTLQHLQEQANLSGRQARWLETLQEFDVTIVYKPGKSNIVADALSRRPDLSLNAISTAQPAYLDRIRDQYPNDPDFGEIFEHLTANQAPPGTLRGKLSKYHIIDGILYFLDNRVCVPVDKRLREDLIHAHHDAPIAGHLGVDKTYLALQRQFFWPRLDKAVRRYVTSCDQCQRNKPINQAPAGLLQPLPVPTKPWESISMDFITHMPTTKRGNDAVFVVVDRLSKMAHFIPTKDTASATDTAKLFFDNIYCLHGLPESIVSDRDPKFTSKFWKSLFKRIGTRLDMSTANHPQTDGQTERTNRTLKEMLRSVINHRQNDWEDKLPSLEFAYNNSSNATTKTTPFFLATGYTPRAIPVHQSTVHRDLPAVDEHLDRLEAITKAVTDNIHAAQDRQARHADQHRQDETFHVGDLVLLSTQQAMPDTESARPNASLGHKHTGPYKIIEATAPNAYRLALPEGMRIHPVINTSQLRPYKASDPDEFPQREVPRPAPDLIDDIEEYEVEEILAERTHYGKTQFLVKWTGYAPHENSWEPDEFLEHAQDKILAFRAMEATA